MKITSYLGATFLFGMVLLHSHSVVADESAKVESQESAKKILTQAPVNKQQSPPIDKTKKATPEQQKKEAKKMYDLFNKSYIKSIASECFMPLGYGGGITTLEDITQLFSIGVEKVIINSAALNNFDLITKAASIYGNQSIVVSIDVQKNLLGKYPYN
jgi:hypothetical protein